MRSGHLVVLIGSFTTWIFCGAAVSVATSVPVGPPVALGPHALSVEMHKNPEIAMMIERRGYPDWAERIEVDSALPLDTHEVHLYYLRLDKEVAFTRASILGSPHIGLRQFERSLEPRMRERIEWYYLSHDPARRAELAAERAMAAAEGAERNAARVVDSADRTEHVAAEVQQSVHKRSTRTRHYKK